MPPVIHGQSLVGKDKEQHFLWGGATGQAMRLSRRDLREEDAGNYICVATSAGVFDIEAVSYVEVTARGKGKL